MESLQLIHVVTLIIVLLIRRIFKIIFVILLIFDKLILIMTNIISFIQLSFVVLLNCILLWDANCWRKHCSLLETILFNIGRRCILIMRTILIRIKTLIKCRDRIIILLEPLLNCWLWGINWNNARVRLWILGTSCGPLRNLNWRRILELVGILVGGFLLHHTHIIHVVLNAIRRRNDGELIDALLWWWLMIGGVDEHDVFLKLN